MPGAAQDVRPADEESKLPEIYFREASIIWQVPLPCVGIGSGALSVSWVDLPTAARIHQPGSDLFIWL